jgi:hypothetical protein
MKSAFFALAVLAAVAAAGPKIGGRVGYTTADDPFTGLSADGAIFGGQVAFPLMPVLSLELSGTYTSTQSDISMESYLTQYIEDEYGVNYQGDLDGLLDYLENEWGWSNPEANQMLEDYTATYHNLGLAGILRADIPIAGPLTPYIGGGGGINFVVSDADAMLAVIEQQTTGNTTIDPYDHIFPAAAGVLGVTFQPMGMPISAFSEIRLSKPFGDEAGDATVSYFAGANLGF